jgi:hypothetical protein
MAQSNRRASLTPVLNLATAVIEDKKETKSMIAEIKSSLCSETRREALSAMLAQEVLDVYHVCDYLESYDQTDDEEDNLDDGKGNHLNAICRTSICEWMYRVVDHFGVDREGKHAVSYDFAPVSFLAAPIDSYAHLLAMHLSYYSRRHSRVIRRQSPIYLPLPRPSYLQTYLICITSSRHQNPFALAMEGDLPSPPRS